MSGKRLAAATVHYGLAGYLSKLLNFILLPVYATFLSPAEMGLLEVMTTVDTLVVAVSRLGLPGALSRSYFDERDEGRLRDLLVTTSIAVLLSGAAFSGVMLWLGPPLFTRWLPDVPFHPYVLLALVAALLRAPPEIQARLLQARENAGLAARINVAVSLFGTAARYGFVVGLRGGVVGALWAEIATSAFGAAIAVVRHRDDLRGRFRLQLLGPALSYGVPLVPNRVGAWVAESATRWILAGMGAVSVVGNIAVATRIASPIQIAINAFTTAFGPIYFGWRSQLSESDALTEARRAAAGVCAAAAGTAVAVTTGGVVVLRWILPASYAEAAQVIGPVTATLLLRVVYAIVAMELFHTRRTGAVSFVFVVGSLVTIGATTPLVDLWGAPGAVTAQLAGVVVTIAITLVQARQTFPLAIGARAGAVVAATCVFAVSMPRFMPGTTWWADALVGALAAACGGALILGASGVSIAQLRGLRRRKVA